MNMSMLSIERLGQSRLEDEAALDLYLGRIQQNLTALVAQCVQLQTAFANRQACLCEIQEMQDCLGADSPTMAELHSLVAKRR
jgi:hypothetical protein